MSIYKKIGIIVFYIWSSLGYAKEIGSFNHDKTSWELGAKALYLKPELLHFELLFSGDNQAASLGEDTVWAWGFMLYGAYHFNTLNDLNINWQHINAPGSRKINTPQTMGFNAFGTGSPNFQNDTTTVSNFSENTTPQWDAVNLDFGQYFDENKNLRVYAGLGYARIISNTSYGLNGSRAIEGAFNLVGSFDSSYNGVGPRIGADLSHAFKHGLSVYANGTTAGLIGAAKHTSIATDVLSVKTITVADTSTFVLVPELEGKLGATYDYALAKGNLKVDVGWMWINYFHAVRAALSTSCITNPPSVSDFGMQGPYVGMNWVGE